MRVRRLDTNPERVLELLKLLKEAPRMTSFAAQSDHGARLCEHPQVIDALLPASPAALT